MGQGLKITILIVVPKIDAMGTEFHRLKAKGFQFRAYPPLRQAYLVNTFGPQRRA